MTPEALRQLNRLRTFAHGFNNLQPGDELDVPVAIGDKKKPATSALQDDAETRKVANVASRAGAFLANNPNGEAALSLARGQVSAEASGQVEQWLNQFGTARVQLDTGEHFSLKNSQLDLLIPFYEQKDTLFFTQGSLHRTDDRTQANLGFGTRYFTPSYMLGSNIFGDYDLSRSHSRLGAGMEYWRDFLKLSANGYLRLSDWRDSPNLTDYQERPANGWDVRAQAWFPGLPQLGGKLTFEQYYGKDVALFGKENRQNNPHAIAAGVNFTPIPLLTLGAEHRQGQSGKNDSRLSMDMTYRPGVPWQQQINPQEVASMRSLSGSRYDLVERNNHMVLQYRKQEVIRLHTATRVVGQAGEQKSLSVSVDSKYGLERIDWSASSLLAAGGILQRDDAGGWSVILPPYQSGEQAANTWTISGVAVDKKGNVSARSHTQVVLAQQESIDASMSPVAPQKITFQADGQMQQQLVLKINDRDGKPIDVAENEISVLRESKLRTTSLTEITPFTRRAAGEFTATVTAGTQLESFTLIPSARNVRFAPVSIEVTAIDEVIVVKDPIIAMPTSAIVGEKVTYTAMLTDKQGIPKGAGIPVNWGANKGSDLSAQTTSTDETGTVVVDLTRTEPGLAKVSLTLPSGEKKDAPDVPFSADAPDENRSELTLEPPVIVSGKGSATLTLILRDKNGNTLPGNKVHGQSNNSSVKISHAEEIADKPGHYRMEVTASKAGKAVLSVNVNGKPFSQSKTLTIDADNASARITQIKPDKLNITADDETGITWRARVTDTHGNALEDVMVKWQLSGSAEAHAANSRTDINGIAAVTVKSHTIGELVMSASLAESDSVQAEKVTVTHGAVNQKESTFTVDKTTIAAGGREAATLTVSLKDSHNNAITGKKVSITGANNLPGFTLSEVIDNKDGSYQAKGTSKSTGKVTLGAVVEGKTIGSDILLTVGASITPNLHFEKVQQSVIWTRNFRDSQAATGVPDGVKPQWSSSDKSVATVDDTGQVTLLRAGLTTITVQTPGDAQNNPGQASYELKIDKADPQLQAGDGNPIKARWADGKTWSVAPTFGNADAAGSLIPTWASKNSAVVTVTDNGVLQAVKPGSTHLTVSTPETDQFKAASVEVFYLLDKGTVDLSFKEAVIKTTDEKNFTLQPPTTLIPSDAVITWGSSDVKVLNISSTGILQGKVSKGKTRLTLSVTANDYYLASSGYYDVLVYSKPSVSMGAITYASKDKMASKGNWTPVFVNDNLFVTWHADNSNEFSTSESVTVYLKDNSGNVLAQEKVLSPSGVITTKIKPQTQFWDKILHIELAAKGYETLTNRVDSAPIKVVKLAPGAIWSHFTVQTHIETHTSEDQDHSCQDTWLGREHWNVAMGNAGKISFDGKTLLSPMLISARANTRQNDSKQTVYFDKKFIVTSDQNIVLDSVKIASECWKSHDGGYRIGINVEYGDQTYTYWAPKSHGWGGNGDGMYRDNLDNF